MSFRLFVIKLRRQAVVIFICGLLSCVIIVILLALCNSPGESYDHYTKRMLDQIGKSSESHGQSHVVSANLIIVVISSPSNIESRNVIRQTWASSLPNGAVVRFVIGLKNLPQNQLESISQESNLCKDLTLLTDFEDSYRSLTLKIVATLKWVKENVKFNFLMKVDEDSFVRVDKVLKELLQMPQKKLYWGFFDGRAHVRKSGQWMEKDYVLCDRYIPYALGGGYILSEDLVEYLAINSKYFKMFKSEDVAVGTWLGPLDIHRIHDPNFDTEYRSRGCYNSYIVTHKKSAAEMRQLYINLKSRGSLCSQEVRVRLSYQYNWEDLPTKCCIRVDPSIP